MKDTFYTTTPIYYTNWVPHIGHRYASLICDILTRYNKSIWKDTKFATGVDENSQKALQKAHELDMDIMDYLDMMAKKHRDVWDGLDISYTDFIRTTEKRHHMVVREVLQKSYDAGDIYEWVYEWYYCVGCEAFIKKDDLTIENWDLVCPIHLTKSDYIKEKNWFFRLSKYEDFLRDFYKSNPDFIIPHDRYNEVIAFVDRWLEDFSISRETNTFGIKLPFDESQVTYVWFDALVNYLTVCFSPDSGSDDAKFWPRDLHVVAKDIIKFHGIYWPRMLKSAGYELPRQILTTWFFTIDGHKISKSLWNVIDPVEFSNKYSRDMMVLYLFWAINLGQDGDFSQKDAIAMYNAKLANNLWNLLNRVLVLSLKLETDPWVLSGDIDSDVRHSIDKLVLDTRWEYARYDLKKILDDTFRFIDSLNKYIDTNKPWATISSDPDSTRLVLNTTAEWLRIRWLILYPYFNDKMLEIFDRLWLERYVQKLDDGRLFELFDSREEFRITEKWVALYDRFDS